jgi:hypothetical protein
MEGDRQMKIPMGNFGNVVAQPQQQAQIPGSDGIGQAVSKAGNALGDLASGLAQAEEKKGNAQAGATFATLVNDMHDMHDEIGRNTAEGRSPADQAMPEFDKRMGELVAERTKDLTANQRQLIDSHIIKASGTLKRSLNDIAIKRTQADTGSNLMTMGEQFQRSAMRDLPGAVDQFGRAVDTMGPQAGWDPVKMATVKQTFKEGATFNYHNAALEGAAQNGGLDVVRSIRANIEGPDGEPIDPARRTQLITKAYAYENGILAAGVRDAEKAAREQLARENAGTDAYNKAFDLWAQGRYFSQDFISETSQVVSGTAAQKQFLELVKSQAQVAGFASQSLPKQQAELERLRAAGSDPQVGVNATEQKVQEQLVRIHEASVKAYEENPWQAAQERGVIQDAPTVTASDLQQAQGVLAERMKTIGSVEVAAGRKISPLQPQEAEQIGRLVRALPPDQQSSALASFSTLIGDPDRLTAFAQQVDKKDPVLATMMMIGDLKTTAGRYVMELGLKGERAIKDKSITIDSKREFGWHGGIAKEIGDAFPSDDIRKRMIEAAYYVNAGFVAEGGSADLQRAVRLTAGRIVEHNGSRIPLPRGMEENDFEKRLKAITPAALAAQTPGGQVFIGKTGIPVEQFVKSLPDAVLVHAGPGKYNVRAGMGLVTNQQGKRITIGVLNANR